MLDPRGRTGETERGEEEGCCILERYSSSGLDRNSIRVGSLGLALPLGLLVLSLILPERNRIYVTRKLGRIGSLGITLTLGLPLLILVLPKPERSRIYIVLGVVP